MSDYSPKYCRNRLAHNRESVSGASRQVTDHLALLFRVPLM